MSGYGISCSAPLTPYRRSSLNRLVQTNATAAVEYPEDELDHHRDPTNEFRQACCIDQSHLLSTDRHAAPAAHLCSLCSPSYMRSVPAAESCRDFRSQAVLNAAVWPACGCPLVSSKVTCFANILLRYKACCLSQWCLP